MKLMRSQFQLTTYMVPSREVLTTMLKYQPPIANKRHNSFLWLLGRNATPEKFRNIDSIILCIEFPLLLAYMYYIRKFNKVWTIFSTNLPNKENYKTSTGWNTKSDLPISSCFFLYSSFWPVSFSFWRLYPASFWRNFWPQARSFLM